jgi:hypothetical protein
MTRSKTAKRYKINPDFVAPEPTAATYHAFLTEDEYRAGEHERIFDGWRDSGVKHARVTIVNDEYPHDPYPHGIWLEGWTDENARCLPFGEAEKPGGAISPPLTAQVLP